MPQLHIFRTVGSTNDVARELAASGAPEGTTVVAYAQARGRGRRGRSWHVEPGQCLVLSMVARPRAPGESVLSLRLGLAAARAIEEAIARAAGGGAAHASMDAAALAVGVKWPNDLVIDGRKVGGILCEGVFEGGAATVIAGIGINVLQDDDDWTGPLAGRATSLAAVAPRPPGMGELAGWVVTRWRAALDAPGDRLSPDERAELERRSILIGRHVTVDGAPAGVVEGVDPDGALRLHGGGETRRVVSGTIRLAKEPEGGSTS